MRGHLAIAFLEFSRIPKGIAVLDKMVKRAPISFVRSGTISDGRFLIGIAGSTASVEESYQEGLHHGGPAILHSLFLPQPHVQLFEALVEDRKWPNEDAMLILESNHVCSMVQVVDDILKGMDVQLFEIRLADAVLAGKSIAILEGPLEELEAGAVQAQYRMSSLPGQIDLEVIAAPQEDMRSHVHTSTNFTQSRWQDLKGEHVE